HQGSSRHPNDWVLSNSEVKAIFKLLLRVEAVCGWPPDMEWTQPQGKLTRLQARPMTQPPPWSNDLRSWYLSLKPGKNRMRALRDRITQILIPELEKTGKRFSKENLESLNDRQLARAIRERKKSLAQWKKTYHDDFIPFAHGVRQLATYYNDIVKPENPYEFVGLLNGEVTLASLRMKEIKELAQTARGSQVIRRTLKSIVSDPTRTPERVWNMFIRALKKKKAGTHFLTRFEDFLNTKLDLVYGTQSLRTRPDIILNMIHQMVERPDFGRSGQGQTRFHRIRGVLERRFFRLAGLRRKKEAQEILSVARLSWRLRDDDNVLLGRIESQCLRAVSEGERRLNEQKRWPAGTSPAEDQAEHIAHSLLDPKIRVVFSIDQKTVAKTAPVQPAAEKARQLVGQPVAPGLATGIVRRVSGAADMIRFQAGEVLVCDSIQPSITHLVPLACAIVERRGGMLMHGAIVARELGRPCVNGIPRVTDLLRDGERVTVDGYLGIVTVGEPEFDLENRSPRQSD
nr:hypothetical protein [Elusimicrobiota bacterium]